MKPLDPDARYKNKATGISYRAIRRAAVSGAVFWVMVDPETSRVRHTFREDQDDDQDFESRYELVSEGRSTDV